MAHAAIEALLEANRGGLWFVPAPAPANAVKAAAKAAGFAYFHLEGRNISRKEHLLKALSVALRFPSHFGDNWDALEECLTEIESDADGFVLFYDHIDGLHSAHPDQVETFVEIARDAVASWKEDGIAMVVLFSGSKPPKGVSRLKAAE